MSLKVIGAGLPRTGTFSLKCALEQLGFDKCHHMFEVVENTEQMDYFIKGSEGKEVDWEELFKDQYQASVDMPSMYFYKDLMSRYPNAKVVLTVRDPQAWYDSVKSTIWNWHKTIPKDTTDSQKLLKLDNIFFGMMLGNQFEDMEHSINFFKRHVEEVKRFVPEEKLLVFQVSEGWEPLCKFLGVDVPDTPFPAKNSKQAMLNKMTALEEYGHNKIDSTVLHS